MLENISYFQNVINIILWGKKEKRKKTAGLSEENHANFHSRMMERRLKTAHNMVDTQGHGARPRTHGTIANRAKVR